jgi:hypothetical protein
MGDYVQMVSPTSVPGGQKDRQKDDGMYRGQKDGLPLYKILISTGGC